MNDPEKQGLLQKRNSYKQSEAIPKNNNLSNTTVNRRPVWYCEACGTMNDSSAVNCVGCNRPHLAENSILKANEVAIDMTSQLNGQRRKKLHSHHSTHPKRRQHRLVNPTSAVEPTQPVQPVRPVQPVQPVEKVETPRKEEKQYCV